MTKLDFEEVIVAVLFAVGMTLLLVAKVSVMI